MSAALSPTYTLAEYLAREQLAEYKSEYYRGEIVAMAGGSPRHNRICAKIMIALGARIHGTPCFPYGSDQRIYIPTEGLSTYPDISVIRGELQPDAKDRDAAVNPRVIFEVLSTTTETYNRGKKFDFYREIRSLEEYILVAQEEPKVERFVRQGKSWVLTVFKGVESTLEMPSLRCELPLSEIYEGVVFGPE